MASKRSKKPDAYQEYLARKLRISQPTGFEPGPLPERLFDFQRDLVAWACRRGRAALFASTGLGKSGMQLSWADQVAKHTGKPVLILCPLAVAAQTTAEAVAFGIPGVAHVRSQTTDRIQVTNYELLHKFDPSIYGGVVIDESSLLKHHDAKTRAIITAAFSKTPFRLACTATPAPNDVAELGNHAEFLGVCSRVEMLAEYFTHDGGETQVWRLKGHAREAFWKWVCAWAAVVRDPSDLGYDASSHALPELRTHEHIVSDESGFALQRGLLFATDAFTLDDQRKARRATLARRVEVAAQLVAANPDEHWLLWCELNDEGDALERAIPGSVQIAGSDTPEEKEDRMLRFVSGDIKILISKSSICGFGLNFQCCANMAFVGVGNSFESYYQAVRRCWRFGQKRPVNVHVISSDVENAVLANLKRKQADALAMTESMAAYTASYVRAQVRGLQRETNAYNPTVKMTVPAWLRSEACLP